VSDHAQSFDKARKGTASTFMNHVSFVGLQILSTQSTLIFIYLYISNLGPTMLTHSACQI
jgi:hypothetical protein